MAEAVLYNVASELLKKLGSVSVQEIGLAWGVKDELHKLASTVSTIRAALLDAEEQHTTNHEVRDWLGKLKDAVYAADDLLEDFSTEVLRRKVMTQNKRGKKVRIFFSSSNQLAFRLKMGHHVRSIREILDAIAADRAKFHFMNRPIETRVENYTKNREETHSFVRVEEVVGRDEDKNAIVERLLDSNVHEINIPAVIPIVGIGGLGKTTLAQFIYNDEKVKKYFELKMWVCVSDVFDLKTILEKIITSATNVKPEHLDLDGLQNCLRQIIDEKRYLLVLDDLWNDDRQKWLRLRDLLIGGATARGSKILVTTRTHLVATITGTVPPYFLQGLPDNESWTLFKQIAFKQGQEPKNSRLVATGKEIVEKCAGVPLAIKTLGSLLYFKDTEAEWLYFRNNELPKIAREENVILPTLKLSYDDLPSCLKQCFAYCSLFPKDHNIDKQVVIKLWIAQGFVQSSDESQHLEDIGDQYFTDLLRRSFFHGLIEDEWGNVYCKMHDLIHDLAQSVAGVECSMENLDAKSVATRILHLSFGSPIDSSWEIPSTFLRAKKIRTFLLPVQSEQLGKLSKSTCDKVVSSFGSLRVLDFHGSWIEKVPSSIGSLSHLRYLDLSNNQFQSFPRSITCLYNLQTLKLNNCIFLRELPGEIKNLVSLRHLELNGCGNLTHMPHGLGQLTSLRTLTQFVVGHGSSAFRPSGGLSELNGLINLRGELRIVILRHLVKCATAEAKEAKLKGNQYLESLRVVWRQEANDSEDAELLMEGLQPLQNLKVLHIQSYTGVNSPLWLLNLVKITLEDCGRCKHLPSFRQLPSLQVLKLLKMYSLEYVDNCNDDGEFSFTSSSLGEEGRGSAAFFPSLKELKLYNLPILKGWWRKKALPRVMGEQQQQQQPSFPYLSISTIEHCPKLISMPLQPWVEELSLRTVSKELIGQQLMMPAPGVSPQLSNTAFVMSSSSLLPFSNLKSLYIDDIEDLVSLPEKGFQNLTSLERLEISKCSSLLNFPGKGLSGLTSLRFLTICFCENLTSLSQGIQHLTALEILKISNCPELDLFDDDDGMQFQGLRSLTSLSLEYIPKLVSLPAGLQDVTTLQTLRIEDCYSLMTLSEWIGNLRLLQELCIYNCPNLTSLPEGMCCLTALKQLIIITCPHLYERCQMETGEDWPKIAHIPEVTVG